MCDLPVFVLNTPPPIQPFNALNKHTLPDQRDHACDPLVVKLDIDFSAAY